MIKNNPLITYHMNTFNRKSCVENLFKSFEICNVYDNFEWVITDYGSSDGTQEYLFDLSRNDKRINLIFNNETIYICNDCLENKMNNYIDKFSVDLINSKCTIS